MTDEYSLTMCSAIGLNKFRTVLFQIIRKMLTLQVGIGHVPGMVEHWGKVTTEQVINQSKHLMKRFFLIMIGQVKEVVKLEPPSLLGRVIRLTVKTAFWGECVYFCQHKIGISKADVPKQACSKVNR